MFAEERQEKLLGILREKRKVAVSEMCDVFNVSGATIRADLRQLEEEGLLTRTHGGAVLRTRASFEQASDAREIVNLSAKERIGQRAAALVEDGDIIVLDTGTTTLHIARNIRDRQNVTVVTNDYQIARELEASPSIQTILLGGIVKKGYHCVVAINGRSILDTLNVDKAFMGTNSLSLKHGACVADIPGKPALRQRGTSRKPAWPPRGSVWSRLTRRWIVSPSKRDLAAVLTCDACLRNSLTSLQVNIVNDFTVAKWRKVILFCHLRHNPSVLL